MIHQHTISVRQRGVLLESLSRKMSPGQAETLVENIHRMNPATIRIHLGFYISHIEQCLDTDMVKRSKLLQQYFNNKIQTINSIISNL